MVFVPAFDKQSLSLVRSPATRHIRDRVLVAFVLTGLAWVYISTLAPSLTWANGGSDSGELIAAAATLGIAHPPGYPTYLLLARLFQTLPYGDLAWRTNLLSVAAALGTVACIYALVRLLTPTSGWSSLAAALAALLFGCSPLFWSQSVIAEVYTLNTLFVALLLLFILLHIQHPQPVHVRYILLQGLLAGLALGNHVTVALPVAAWLTVLACCTPPPQRLRLTLPGLAGLGFGLLIYLYLPLRAATHPAITWGNPATWDGFWWVVSAHLYHPLAFGLAPEYLPGRVAAWATLLVQQFGWSGVVLGFVALVYTVQARAWMVITALLAVLYSAFAITYDTADSAAYLLPVYLIFATWLGSGLAMLLNASARWQPHLTLAILVLLFPALAWHLPAAAQYADASRDTRALNYMHSVLSAAPPGAIILTTSDRDTFALWYAQYALHLRPDLATIAEPLLDFAWYREHLYTIYPALHIPDQPTPAWEHALHTANPALPRICRTQLASPPVLLCPAGR